MNKRLIAGALLSLTLSGCVLIPDYIRPELPVAEQWPAYGAINSGTTEATAIEWQQFFGDARLKRMVELALSGNRNLRVAVLNVAQARAQHTAQRSFLFPDIGLGGTVSRERAEIKKDAVLTNETTTRYAAGLTAAWEIDLFGRLQSLNEAAFEQYLATEEARRSVHIALVGEVATQYLFERALAEQLELALQTRDSVQAAYDLNQKLFKLGQVSELELRASEAQLHTARINIAAFQQQLAQAQNLLALLVGQPLPADLPQPLRLENQQLLADLSPALPSSLLERRPDILAAEHQLKAASANIGAARAAFFPRIELTGSAGFASGELSNLFDGGGAWTFAPTITMPLFQGGRNFANLDIATIRAEIEVANYERTIQQAFREVADALAARAMLSDQIAAQSDLLVAQERRFTLATARYKSGVDAYLDVLTAQQDLYAAQRNLIQYRFERLANLIALYRALGGGWTAADNS